METLGSSTPDAVFDQIDRIKNALMECQPFNNINEPVNQNLLETTLDAAQKLVLFVENFNRIHADDFIK